MSGGHRGSRLTRRLALAAGLIVAVALAIAASSPASFSGANGKIYFEGPEGSNSSGPGDIYSINPDGSGKIDLTEGLTTTDERPAASADGQHVVFQSFRDEGWNIIAMNSDGSSPVNLTKTEQPVVNFEPGWSPDGAKVTFMRQNLTPGEQDIWVMNANGTGQVNLTQSPLASETAPEFSPDGSKIVYMRAGEGDNNNVWVMNANGTNPTQLTFTVSGSQKSVGTWSPDGSRIAFTQDSSSSPTTNGLYVMKANGEEQTQILNGSAAIASGNISWSPDGTKLVYERSGSGGLFLVSPSGGASTTLESRLNTKFPSWVPVATGSDSGSSTPPPSSGGSSTPPPATGGPVPGPTPPLKCKKSQKKKVVKGKAKCVRRHKAHKHKPKH